MPGIFALQGVLAALTAIEGGGTGQKVEVSMLGALLALETQLNAAQSNASLEGGWHLSAPTDAPIHPARAKDLAIDFGFNARSGDGWDRFCRTLNIPDEIAQDPRFNTGLARTLNWDAFVDAFEPYVSQKTAAELKQLVEEYGGISVIYNTYKTLFQDPQVEALEMLRDIEHPALGTIKTLGLPWNLAKTPGSLRAYAPELGQHTEEVLAGLAATLSVGAGSRATSPSA
jgi:crotonobetainyl-CoA:carnitine CoA-transferase CaiB-like acyl-CoA transferase